MIVRTDAVVLRAIDHGETSQIVSLLTRRHGRIGVIARGSRRPKSRFGSTLQPMACVQVVYYYKPSRGLQALTEASHLRLLSGISADVERITLGLRMVELVRALTQEGEQNPALLNLLLASLDRLDGAGHQAANVLFFFQLRFAVLLGFAPDVQREDVLALPEEGGVLALESGAIRPPGARARAGLRASRAGLRAFAILARSDLETAMRMRLTEELRAEVERLVDAYLEFHTEEAYPSRVSRVAAQLAGRTR